MQSIARTAAIVGLWSLAMPLARAGTPKQAPTLTLAEELMAIELKARKEVPAGAHALLQLVLADAAEAATSAALRPPRTREDALPVLAAIQKTLAAHHFVQPLREEDWPDTMGQALVLHGQSSPSFYYVDCDMAVQLFISVGQREGWDLRLVEANQKHLFVRWHLPGGEVVNWDWTFNRSMDDAEYRKSSDGETPQARELYLHSFSPDAARAYYKALIAAHADDAAVAERLFKGAQPLQGEHPRFLNNLGWFYATHPGVPKEKRSLGLGYAITGWSYRPMNSNNMDTVACAFAAYEKREQALLVEDMAISTDDAKISLTGNRKLIADGKLCAR